LPVALTYEIEHNNNINIKRIHNKIVKKYETHKNDDNNVANDDGNQKGIRKLDQTKQKGSKSSN
jgi:hypothetical protein